MIKSYIYYSSTTKINLDTDILPISSQNEDLGEMFYGEKKEIKRLSSELITTILLSSVKHKKK